MTSHNTIIYPAYSNSLLDVDAGQTSSLHPIPISDTLTTILM